MTAFPTFLNSTAAIRCISFFDQGAARLHRSALPARGYFLYSAGETRGLPEDFILDRLDTAVRLPMRPTLRSLNLSNTVAVAVYEVLRQGGFEGSRMRENSVRRNNYSVPDGNIRRIRRCPAEKMNAFRRFRACKGCLLLTQSRF